MEEIKDINEEVIEKPQWHYEVVKEYKKEVPVYDEEGNQTGTQEIVTGRVLKKVYDDEVLIKKERIKELKQLLKDSDYRAIKYAEGQYTKTEYAPYKEQRKAYRDEINALEEELQGLENN